MPLSTLSEFLDNAKSEYNLSSYRIDIYHNKYHVYYKKQGYSFWKNISNHYISVNPKIICCLAIIILFEDNNLSLNETIKKYVNTSSIDNTIRNLLIKYLNTTSPDDEKIYFKNIVEIIEQLLGYSFIEYINFSIIKPLKMYKTTFNDVAKEYSKYACIHNGKKGMNINIYINTTIKDYQFFCNKICNINITSRYKTLKKAVTILTKDIMRLQENIYSYIGFNGEFNLIDAKNNLIVIFSCNNDGTLANPSNKMCSEIQKIIYNFVSNKTRIYEYNLFP